MGVPSLHASSLPHWLLRNQPLPLLSSRNPKAMLRLPPRVCVLLCFLGYHLHPRLSSVPWVSGSDHRLHIPSVPLDVMGPLLEELWKFRQVPFSSLSFLVRKMGKAKVAKISPRKDWLASRAPGPVSPACSVPPALLQRNKDVIPALLHHGWLLGLSLPVQGLGRFSFSFFCLSVFSGLSAEAGCASCWVWSPLITCWMILEELPGL